MYLYIVQMGVYLSIVQIGRGLAEAAPDIKPTGNETMSALTNLGRFFDTGVAVVFVLISLSLAGATAVVGV
jgi:hypothetical protein